MKMGRISPIALLVFLVGAATGSAQVTAVDATGNVGQFSSMIIGSDGLPLISYANMGAPSALKVAHCTDPACATPATITTLDPDDGGLYTSIALGADERGLIAYARSNTRLRVAHCDNVACTSASLATLDNGNFVGVDLAIGADGRGLISYFDVANNDLKVAHCNDVACSSATITPLDTTPAGGSYTSVAVGADGLGLIAYNSGNLGGPGGDVVLKVARCDNTSCTTATLNPVDPGLGQPGEYVGSYPAITFGLDGLGIISYRRQSAGMQEMKVAHCSNATCSAATLNPIESATQTGVFTSIAIGGDGFPLISYLFQATGGDLKVARCSDPACASATFQVVDGPDSVGHYSSVSIGRDGLPIISYFDETNFDLKVAHCLDEFCGAPSAPRGFFTLTPCRLMDTRNPPGPLGGPALNGLADRSFSLAGVCGIPPTAKALALNLVATGASSPGHLRLHPAGTVIPSASAVNYVVGQTRANNAIAPLNAAGALAVYCGQLSGTVHFVLDVYGYFE